MVKSTAASPVGAKCRILSCFLRYFQDRWNLNVKVSLSDKDWSEINACRQVFPNAKHQLCFWHCLQAIKKRLAILRRQPGPYNVNEAMATFSFINSTFLPLAQQPLSAPQILIAKKPIPRLSVRLAPPTIDPDTVMPDGTGEEVVEESRTPPRIVLKVFGQRVMILSPQTTDHMEEWLTNLSGDSEFVEELDSLGEGEAERSSDDDADVDADSMTDAGDVFWERVSAATRGCEQDIDSEDAPDYEFEEGETHSRDPTYTFCPAQHRAAVLHIFTKHFVCHPIFPS
jgi:hypothetical protein